ncbi:MAG: phage portal protein, partial [Bryobacterales bacterium]|nr:phage portal protein [Bryobacterales bacterium]
MRAVSPNAYWDNPVSLRARAEAEYRNNPYARKVVDAIVCAVWGASAINPTFKSKANQTAWSQWTGDCDATGRLDWSGLGAAVLQTVIVSGEAFVVFQTEGRGVPLRLLVLGPEYLDTSRSDSTTYAGIRYAGNRPAGYWLYRQNPANAAVFPESTFVPASDCLHVFRPIAPGAQRGQSWLAPVLLPLRELNEYLEANLVKAKVSALFAGFVRTPNGSNPLLNADGVPQLEPGTMTRLQPEESVEFSEPPDAGPTFDPFVRAQLRRIAAAAGIPYEIVSGDLSAVTFASGRHGLLEYRRTVEMVQYGLMVPQFCEPIRRRWEAMAAALGIVDSPEEMVR